MAKAKTYKDLKSKDKAKVDAEVRKISEIFAETFSRIEHDMDKARALDALTACVMGKLNGEARLKIDPPRYRFIDNWTVGPADRYTAMLMACGLNNLPILFNRETCPEVLETALGTFRVDEKDFHIIFCPVKALDYINVVFKIDGDGQLRGAN